MGFGDIATPGAEGIRSRSTKIIQDTLPQILAWRRELSVGLLSTCNKRRPFPLKLTCNLRKVNAMEARIISLLFRGTESDSVIRFLA